MPSRWFQQPFCQTFPVAHLMRAAFPEHWLRIHSLPESKRYPEDDAEREIIFARYSNFGSALLGENAPCLLIQSCFNGFPRPGLMPELDWKQIHRVGDDEDDSWNSWVASTLWQPANFKELLLDIAEEREAKISFLSTQTDCIFSPYDGGADGFSFDTSLLKRLFEEFAPWRSSLPSGL